VIVASVWFSSLIGTDSFASIAQALGVATAFEDATGELVDDHDLSVADEVVDIKVVEGLGFQRYVEMVDEVDVCEVVHVVDAEHLFDPGNTFFGRDDLSLLLVDLVVVALSQPGGDLGELGVPLPRLAHATRDDQRRPGLVDEDRVDLIDDRKGVSPLHHVLGVHRHVVTQVIEPELVVRPVGDVGCVRGAALFGCHPRLNQTHFESEESMDVPHPLGITTCEVVVDRDDVDTPTGEGVEVRRHRGYEGLSFTGLHLGDLAPMKRSGSDHLDVVGPLSQNALCSFSNGGEGLCLDVVECLTVGEPLPEPGRAGTQFVV